jgi:hypothetical protein
MPRQARQELEAMAKTTLKIVVSGDVTEVERNDNAPLRSVIGKALEQTGHAGQAGENWILKDKDGNSLDVDRKIGDFGFADGVVLYLSLEAGVAG